MNTTAKNVFLWIVIIVAVVVLWNFLNTVRSGNVDEVNYSDFTSMVKNDKLRSNPTSPVTLSGNKVEGSYIDSVTDTERKFRVIIPKGSEETIANTLNEKGIIVKVNDDDQNSFVYMLLTSWFPIILFVGFWIFLMRQMQSGGNKALSFGKSRAKLSTNHQKKVTFKDVAGVEEAKEELQEIIEFLKEPQKFQKLGGRMPKGVLLMGPPGTGKTLLARAIAGEASVPFFSISGSDFVEMFVGVGASRVRDLFEQGKKNAPCIIFIDEIDAVGRHRGAGLGGGHDEREQTLNQLLVEMDGFESNEGVILIAATNRPDVLDPALLRPGRIDREVVVTLPDIKGREGIIKVHTRRIPFAKDVDISILARGTPGMSGAQLANLVNEAALNASRFDRKSVAMADFEEAKDKVLMGKERKSMIMSDEEKRNTAYHEAGHALAAHLLPDADPLHKVTIIPRGRALGVTTQLPAEDKYSYTREYMEASLTILLAGRVAEELVLGSCTTGASNDLERVTERARKMVCEWGMSEEIGPLSYGKKEEQIFLGREIAQHQDYSENTAMQIDKEVKKVVLAAYAEAKELLEENRDALILVAEALLEYETLDGNEVTAVIKGEKIHREPEVEPPDAPEPEQEEKEQEKSLPSLVNPDERPAPA
ncbi:MAG: ATP-dependent metallopeptidase FtsH/Yme1/Tma family protein [Acidobacteria bacterium]|nr:MAG: ATP-dependent metallopeptidase FtsH/Yme1/Tma family protein [Acidobacteriota bacterium]